MKKRVVNLLLTEKRTVRRFLRLILCLLLIATALPPIRRSAAFDMSAPAAPFDGYLVKVSGVRARHVPPPGAESLGGGLYRVDTPGAAATLGGEIEYIEPNYILYELGDPIDDYTPPQWNTAAVGVQAVWALGLFGEGVKVGLVDSGLRTTHEDLLSENILPVVNFTGDGQSILDASGHGTLVGGVIAARVGNAQSQGSPAVDGAAPGVTVLPLRVFSPTKTATVSMAVAAIRYAVDADCDVINLSIGTTAFSAALKEACDDAAAAGVLLVAAAGNWGGTAYGYPASFDSVVSVAAVWQQGDDYTRPAFSQHNDKVFITAPGFDITGLGAAADTAYVSGKEGTSYAAPIVTAMAALAKEQNRAVTPATFRSLLAATAVDLGPEGRDNAYGWGMADMAAFVNELTRAYRVTYANTEGLADWPDGDTYTLDMTQPLALAVPVRQGYAFTGWHTASSLTDPPVYEIAPGSAGDLTLYAAWEAEDSAGVQAIEVAGIPATQLAPGAFGVTVPKNCTVKAGDIHITPFPSGAAVEDLHYDADCWRFLVRTGNGGVTAFTLTVTHSDNSAPELVQGDTASGSAAPASLDGLVEPVPFALTLSAYFSDPDGDSLSYQTVPADAAVDADTLRYLPLPSDAGTTATFTVTARDGEFSGPPLTVTIGVTERPASRSLLALGSAQFDHHAPAAVTVPLILYDNTLQSVSLPAGALEPGTDYTLHYSATDGQDAVVLSAAALGRLPVGNHILTFAFSAGGNAALPLSVIDSAPRHTVTFIAEGSTPYARYPDVRDGATIPLPTVPVKSGSTFGGWYTGQNGTGTRFTAETPVVAPLTLYAKWSTVSLGGSGGGSAPPPVLFKITAEAGPGGAVTPAELSVVNGGEAAFTVTPNDGYLIRELLVDGAAVPLPANVSAPYVHTFENVTAAHTLHVSFVPAEEALLALGFSDVSESDWYYAAVRFVCGRGLFLGVDSTTFAPGGHVTRGMAVTVLWRMGGVPAAPHGGGFADVAADAWYGSAVLWAAEAGVAGGYGDGRFGPDDELSREQLAVFLHRYAVQNALTNGESGDLDGFSDATALSPWAEDAMRWAVGTGLITGKDGGCLDPRGPATRAELAAILARFSALSEGS